MNQVYAFCICVFLSIMLGMGFTKALIISFVVLFLLYIAFTSKVYFYAPTSHKDDASVIKKLIYMDEKNFTSKDYLFSTLTTHFNYPEENLHSLLYLHENKFDMYFITAYRVNFLIEFLIDIFGSGDAYELYVHHQDQPQTKFIPLNIDFEYFRSDAIQRLLYDKNEIGSLSDVKKVIRDYLSPPNVVYGKIGPIYYFEAIRLSWFGTFLTYLFCNTKVRYDVFVSRTDEVSFEFRKIKADLD